MNPSFICVFVKNDVDEVKVAPPLNSPKVDVPSPPKSVSGAMDDSEMKKIMDECKRLQMQVSKLCEENRQLKVSGFCVIPVTILCT